MITKLIRFSAVPLLVLLQACGGGGGGGSAAPVAPVQPTDTAAPVITLAGDNPQAVELNGTYVEAGATADTGETVEIESSAVDTTTAGSYTVTYNATDAAGNIATEVTRAVTVQDTTGPVITLLSDSEVTVARDSVYEDAGATADGDETVVIDASNVDTSVPGTYTVTFNATDAAGNAAQQLQRTVSVEFFKNLDFEIADGANWTVEGGNSTDEGPVPTASSFPVSEGNSGGYWSMDANTVETWWTVLYTEVAPISVLGLETGLIYSVSQDSKIFSSQEGKTATVAGMKVEFFRDAAGEDMVSDTGDLRVDPIESGAEWATYSFEYQIPAETTHIKYVVLWGNDSHVGVDNVVISTEGTTPPVATYIVSSDADGMAEIMANGNVGTTELGGWNNTVGEWYGGAAGYIGFFQLPDLGEVNYPFTNSEFGVRVFETTSPDWAADVSMVRVADNTDILDTDYGSEATLIQSSFLTSAVVEAVGTGGGDRNLFTTTEASMTLTEGLNVAYDGGQGVGEYVVIRIAKSGALPEAGSYKILTRNAGGDNEHPIINFTLDTVDTSLPGDAIRAADALVAAHSGSTTGGTVSGPEPEPAAGGLITNGDFQSGSTGWTGADNAITSYFAVAETASNNVYDVNLSQSMTLVPDSEYRVSFKAKSSIARTILAGLGLYHDPWTNVGEEVSLTTEWQTFTLTQTTAVDGVGFGDDDSRVLFDMGGDQGGQVWIDDVSVTTADSTELVVNGDFQNGVDSWAGGAAAAANITSYFAVDVATAGNVYDVNLSYTMTLVPDTDYELSFKAKGSVERTMLAGLGLYHDPWTNVTETVNLTTDWQTFTYTINTAGFGDDNSRVLFDMGGETGQVWIDDVSVQ